MAETSKNVRQRHMQANYINVGAGSESYVLMGLGFTDLNESPAAQTSSKRYVNDKANTKRITGYDWTAPFTTDQIRSDTFISNLVRGRYLKYHRPVSEQMSITTGIRIRRCLKESCQEKTL